MDVTDFCSLCGLGFESHALPVPPKNDWTKMIRAVRSPVVPSDEVATSELSGLGYFLSWRHLSGLDELDPFSNSMLGGSIVGSWEPESSISDSASVEHDTPLQPLGRREKCHAYGFHEFCWQLLVTRVESIRGPSLDRTKIGQKLFELLESLPWTREDGVIPPNKFYGAFECRKDPDEMKHAIADPCQNLELAYTQFNRDRQPVRIYRPQVLNQHLDNQISSSVQDPFSKLHNDALDLIFTHLPTKDLLNARLSSRHIAAHSTETDLPLSFWASRFDLDMEMGFVFAHEPKARHRPGLDWFQMYRDCKDLQLHKYSLRLTANGSSWRGLQNRRRIWRCVDDFAVGVSST